MRLRIQRTRQLQGRIQVPGDKSISHRALLLGGLADGPCRVHNFLPGADCGATLRCLRALGVQIDERSPTELTVWGVGLRGLREPEDVLDCGGSATAMRLLAGVLAGQPFLSVLTGNEGLRRRPMQRIIEPLRQMGASLWGRRGDRLPPLAIRGGPLRGIDYELPVASAQVKSCLLLAGLFAGGPTVVREPGPARDHTERMLASMGADLSVHGPVITLKPGGRLSPMEVNVPGDFSSAAFFLVAGCLVSGSELLIEGVGLNPTRTGLLEVLSSMGADIGLENERLMGSEPVGDLLVRPSELRAAEVSGPLVVRMIDEFPVLAVAATQAQGETVVRDAQELRVKESDRIEAIVSELRKLGARIEERVDGFVVEGPTPLRGTVVDSRSDHRLAMALAVAGLIAEGETVIEGAECIADSFPGFEETLRSL